MGEGESRDWKRRKSERRIEQGGKRNRKLSVGDSKALHYNHPSQSQLLPSHRLEMKERERGQKRPGPSPRTEGLLSLPAEEHGVLQYSPQPGVTETMANEICLWPSVSKWFP